jgi:polyisoprenoid-binding protein YceI
MLSLACLLLPAVAVLAAFGRWLLQERGNLYTDASTTYYVPDPDLDWRVVENGPVSIGMDAIAVLFCFGVALFVALLLLRRWERRRGVRLPIPAAAGWIVAALPLLVPAWAFASGSFPQGAVYSPPAGVVNAPDSISGGVPGLPPGTYRVVPHAGTSLRARLSAGGEKFDARFASDIEGSWRGAPADLRQPMSADLSVGVAAVDTGIELRSKHAREDYLQAAKFPRIRFRLGRLVGAGPAGPNESGVAYRADGVVELMGRSHPVAVTGTLRPLDDAARQRQGFAAGEPVFRATAQFELAINQTALAPDASDFDGNVIPIEVNLLLRREAEPHR